MDTLLFETQMERVSLIANKPFKTKSAEHLAGKIIVCVLLIVSAIYAIYSYFAANAEFMKNLDEFGK